MPAEVDKPRKIVLGVTGGIASYKAAELVRLLTERGHRVQVVMTSAAQRFIRPLTFASLSGERVITDLFAESSAGETLQSAIEHIGVAQSADLLLVAPATADILAKFAHGIANDFLSTTYLAYAGPVVLAPAMNTQMWRHPATRQNVALLRERGAMIVEPESGSLACGMLGPGRLADLNRIVEQVQQALPENAPSTTGDLAGETVLITSGPTQENLDPVRFLSNRSSGRMGFALASEALGRGARVVVVSGPASLMPPEEVELVRVTSAEQMYRAVLDQLPQATMVICAAAVADYRLRQPFPEKMKKGAGNVTLELEPTVDILSEVGRRKGSRLLIGFAAETANVVEAARQKLQTKNCDLMVANPVGESAGGVGFDSEENQGWLIPAAGDIVEVPRTSKREMARRIFDQAWALRRALATSQT